MNRQSKINNQKHKNIKIFCQLRYYTKTKKLEEQATTIIKLNEEKFNESFIINLTVL